MATFGENDLPGIYGLDDIQDIIRGTWYTCTLGGIADSMTGYLQYAGAMGQTLKVKYAIYDYVGGGDAGNLVGVTDEISEVFPFGLNVTAKRTANFSAPKPVLSPNTKYFLVAWADNLCNATNLVRNQLGEFPPIAVRLANAYNGYPNPMVGEASIGSRYKVLCTYTPIARIPRQTATIGLPHII